MQYLQQVTPPAAALCLPYARTTIWQRVVINLRRLNANMKRLSGARVIASVMPLAHCTRSFVTYLPTGMRTRRIGQRRSSWPPLDHLKAVDANASSVG